MDILPGSWGANRGERESEREREEFRSAMRRQAARSHENIEEIIAYLLMKQSQFSCYVCYAIFFQVQ